MLQNKNLRHVGIILGIIILSIGSVIFFGRIFGIDLYIQSFTNKHSLNKIQIINGARTNSSSSPNGDALTGSSSPAIATFSVSEEFAKLRSSVNNKLLSQGFYVSGNPSNVSDNLGDNNTFKTDLMSADPGCTIIVDSRGNESAPTTCKSQNYEVIEGYGERLTKGKNSLLVFYQFDTPYECPSQDPLEPATCSKVRSIATPGVQEKIVKEVRVSYDDAANNTFYNVKNGL